MSRIKLGSVTLTIANLYLDKGYKLEEYPFVVFLNYAIVNIALLHPMTDINKQSPIDYSNANNALQKDVNTIINHLLGEGVISDQLRNVVYEAYTMFGENKCHLISEKFENLLIQTLQLPEIKNKLNQYTLAVALVPYNQMSVKMDEFVYKTFVKEETADVKICAFTSNDLLSILISFKGSTSIANGFNQFVIDHLGPDISHDQNRDPKYYGFVLVNDKNKTCDFIRFSNFNLSKLLQIKCDITDVDSELNADMFDDPIPLTSPKVFYHTTEALPVVRCGSVPEDNSYIYYLIPPNEKQTRGDRYMTSSCGKYFQSAAAIMSGDVGIVLTPFTF